ncbi:unnamed protein product [Paramecium octaurelia]|uniref:MORN repeat protein n=1 Tax=Paramecium octaurelia TaxID=43137 RepID=A0A8S1Y2V0_PAROT|nr:unnamed protein product [Paramecium octaurelia]
MKMDLRMDNGQKCTINFLISIKMEKKLKIGKFYLKVKKQVNQNQLVEANMMKMSQTGIWRELHENFYIYGQIIYQGVYSKGKKQQKWVIQYRPQKESNFIEIGGGFYDSEGRKDNLWVELHANFSQQREVLYKGIYKNGIKYDQWETLQMMDNREEIRNIGGGCYDENQLKNGKWTDLYENFNNDAQVKYKGEYKNGKKQGSWKIDFRESKVIKIEMTIQIIYCYDLVEMEIMMKMEGRVVNGWNQQMI